MLKRELIEKYKGVWDALDICPDNFTKATLTQIVNFRCEHRHTAETHPGCYKKSADSLLKPEVIGVLDIETSNLHANFGIILSWCIKVVGEGKIISDVLTKEDIKAGQYDKRVVEHVIQEMRNFDRLVTQFGTYFDIPFIRTRAEFHRISHPGYGEIYHTDVWRIAKRKLRLHSNRQGAIAETVLRQDIKTRIHPEKWLEVQFGDDTRRKAGLKYILDHNEKDVTQLESLYLRLRKYIKEGRTSI